jgi:hypothetical protein
VYIYSIEVIQMNSGQESDSSGEKGGGSDKGTKRLVDRVREAMRCRRYSLQTEKAYWYWIRYFIRFHGRRHPAQMGAAEVTAFLSWLASERNVAAATQNRRSRRCSSFTGTSSGWGCRRSASWCGRNGRCGCRRSSPKVRCGGCSVAWTARRG